MAENKINARGCDKPEIGDLVHHVAPNLNKDWSYLGYELLEAKNSNIIQQIEGNIKGDVTECANKLFERWLKLGYPNTTWNRIIAALEKINLNALAQDISSKLLPAAADSATKPTARHDETDNGNKSNQDTMKSDGVPSSGSNFKAQPKDSAPQSNGMTSGHKAQQSNSGDEVDFGNKSNQGGVANETNENDETDHSIMKDTGKQANSATGHDETDNGNQGEMKEYGKDGIAKKKKSKYPMVQTSKPMYTVIINNHKFNDETLAERRGSLEDVKSLQRLEEYGLTYPLPVLENCTAKEMAAFLKVVASSCKITDILKQATKCGGMDEALRMFATRDKIKSAVEVMTTEECKDALETVTKNEKGQKIAAKILENPLSSNYSGLMVFIMTHGGEGGQLYGSDGEAVVTKDIATLFNASNCTVLHEKPKIFIIQACRGGEEDHGAKRESKGATNMLHKNRNPSFGVVPNEADFLYAYATPEDYVAWLRRSGSPFITSFVDVLYRELNDQHLEEALLMVKDEVAGQDIPDGDGIRYKQVPSVVSQMRDKVWFHK